MHDLSSRNIDDLNTIIEEELYNLPQLNFVSKVRMSFTHAHLSPLITGLEPMHHKNILKICNETIFENRNKIIIVFETLLTLVNKTGWKYIYDFGGGKHITLTMQSCMIQCTIRFHAPKQ